MRRGIRSVFRNNKTDFLFFSHLKNGVDKRSKSGILGKKQQKTKQNHNNNHGQQRPFFVLLNKKPKLFKRVPLGSHTTIISMVSRLIKAESA